MWVTETQTYNNGINDWPSQTTLNAFFSPFIRFVKKFLQVQKLNFDSYCSNSFFGQNITSFFYFSLDFNQIFRDSSLCHMVQKYVNKIPINQSILTQSIHIWKEMYSCTRRLWGRIPPKLDIRSIWFLVCESIRHRPTITL